MQVGADVLYAGNRCLAAIWANSWSEQLSSSPPKLFAQKPPPVLQRYARVRPSQFHQRGHLPSRPRSSNHEKDKIFIEIRVWKLCRNLWNVCILRPREVHYPQVLTARDNQVHPRHQITRQRALHRSTRLNKANYLETFFSSIIQALLLYLIDRLLTIHMIDFLVLTFSTSFYASLFRQLIYFIIFQVFEVWQWKFWCHFHLEVSVRFRGLNLLRPLFYRFERQIW